MNELAILLPVDSVLCATCAVRNKNHNYGNEVAKCGLYFRIFCEVSGPSLLVRQPLTVKSGGCLEIIPMHVLLRATKVLYHDNILLREDAKDCKLCKETL